MVAEVVRGCCLLFVLSFDSYLLCSAFMRLCLFVVAESFCVRWTVFGVRVPSRLHRPRWRDMHSGDARVVVAHSCFRDEFTFVLTRIAISTCSAWQASTKRRSARQRAAPAPLTRTARLRAQRRPRARAWRATRATLAAPAASANPEPTLLGAPPLALVSCALLDSKQCRSRSALPLLLLINFDVCSSQLAQLGGMAAQRRFRLRYVRAAVLLADTVRARAKPAANARTLASALRLQLLRSFSHALLVANSAGYYCTVNATSPTQNICPAGRYGSSTGLSSSACSGACNAGFYCLAGSTAASPAATPCPSGSTSPAGSGDVSACQCTFGYQGSSGTACTGERSILAFAESTFVRSLCSWQIQRRSWQLQLSELPCRQLLFCNGF